MQLPLTIQLYVKLRICDWLFCLVGGWYINVSIIGWKGQIHRSGRHRCFFFLQCDYSSIDTTDNSTAKGGGYNKY